MIVHVPVSFYNINEVIFRSITAKSDISIMDLVLREDGPNQLQSER